MHSWDMDDNDSARDETEVATAGRTGPSGIDSHSIDAVLARLDRLEAENRSLRHTIDGLRNSAATGAPARDAPDNDCDSEQDEAVLSRRRLMLGGGIAAAVGTIAAVGGGTPVAAAPGSLAKDTINGVDAITGVQGSIVPGSASTPVFKVTNLNFDAGTALDALGYDAGVRAQALNGTGAAIFARHSAGGAGISSFVFGDPNTQPSSAASASIRAEVSSSYPEVPAFLALADVTLRTQNLASGVPESTDAEAGDLFVRASGTGGATWWVCAQPAAGGTPARFVRLMSDKSAGAFEALDAPIRVYDSRPAELPATGPKFALADGFERTVSCTLNTAGAVPNDATAVVINLAGTNTSGDGYLAAFPFGQAWGGTASLNLTAGQSTSNTTTVGCGADARITIRAGIQGAVDVVVDVIGFYR